jgi:4-hydroxy-tetrahydrodipicolinate synthase
MRTIVLTERIYTVNATNELMQRLDGVFVPLFTPFSATDGCVNEKQLRSNVAFLLERGIRILNPAGTTGEFWTLTPEEHRLILMWVAEEAKAINPTTIVVAGISTANLRSTLEMARHASKFGADLLQLTPTFYLPMSNEDIVAYYSEVASQVEVPVMIYEIPSATGVSFNCDLLQRVCDACPNVVALKTASPALAPWEFERIVRKFRGRLSIFAATGAYFSPFTYMSGVNGITDTLSNAVPEFGLTLHRLARELQWDELNRVYRDAFDVLEIEIIYGKAGLKEIGNACGRNVGPTRHPIVQTLSAEDRRDIRRRIEGWSFAGR